MRKGKINMRVEGDESGWKSSASVKREWFTIKKNIG